MKYAGFKKGMKVTLKFSDGEGDLDGIIEYSSGQRINVKDENGEYWHFTRHGLCTTPPFNIEMILK